MNWRLLTNISDYVSLHFLQKGIKLPCFVNNNDGLFKVHNMVHDFVSLWCMRAPSHQSTQKSCTRIFNSFSPEVTFMFTSCFIDMNIRTEDCQEFQNCQEFYAITVDICYILMEKNVEHGTEHDFDSAYGVCMHLTFLNFTADSMNVLQLKQVMNLTVC